MRNQESGFSEKASHREEWRMGIVTVTVTATGMVTVTVTGTGTGTGTGAGVQAGTPHEPGN